MKSRVAASARSAGRSPVVVSSPALRAVLSKPAVQPVPAEVTKALPVAAAMTKPQRTLVEVRADLARLRESSRERQAERERTHETNFAPTDFMDFAEHEMLPVAPGPAFAPTAFLDFGAVRARQTR